MARSPIDAMIDKACGYDPSKPPKIEMVTLRCPKCKRTKLARKDKTDPTGTVTVESECPKCADSGDFESPTYYDAKGRQLLPE